MKLLMENWRRHLNEIGEGSAKPYSFSKGKQYTDDYVIYQFFTAEFEYMVTLRRDKKPSFNPDMPSDPPEDDEEWDISFKTIGAGLGDPFGETGEGKPMRVMSTMVAILKDFIASGTNLGVRSFTFEGTSRKSEEEFTQDAGWPTYQRTRLYKVFLKKQVPNADVEEIGTNKIRFSIPPATMATIERGESTA